MRPREESVDKAGFSHVFMLSLLTHLGLINMDRAILTPRRRRLLAGGAEGGFAVKEAISARTLGGDMSRGCILSILSVVFLSG